MAKHFHNSSIKTIEKLSTLGIRFSILLRYYFFMEPSYWMYQDRTKQREWYRGRVIVYRLNKKCHVPCKVVRSTRSAAIKDAKLMLRRMRRNKDIASIN